MVEPKDQGPRKAGVPNIVGQTTTNADSLITNAGFTVGDKSIGSTSVPTLVNTVSAQVITAGEIKPLSTEIDYTYYSPFFPPFFPPHFPPHFPPFFPPFFPPHFPPFFPPFFPPHFPPFFPPHFPPHFPPTFVHYNQPQF